MLHSTCWFSGPTCLLFIRCVHLNTPLFSPWQLHLVNTNIPQCLVSASDIRPRLGPLLQTHIQRPSTMSSQAIPRATSLADKTWGLESLTQARFTFDTYVGVVLMLIAIVADAFARSFPTSTTVVPLLFPFSSHVGRPMVLLFDCASFRLSYHQMLSTTQRPHPHNPFKSPF